MEFDELLITTGVDALVRLVKRKGKIELESAAGLLNISAATIEEWARVLEEEGILEIEYRLTKVYLVWVTPSEEEVATERASFYKEKEGIQKEINEVKEHLGTGIKDLSGLEDEFSQFYKKAYARLEELEKLAGPVVGKKASSEEGFGRQAERVDEVTRRVEDLKNSLGILRKDIGEMDRKVKGTKSRMGLEKIAELKKEIDALDKEGELLLKKASRQHKELPRDVKLPDTAQVKGKLDALAKELREVRTRSARLREDVINIQETQGLLKEVGTSVKDYEKRMVKLKKDAATALKDAEDLEKRSSTISKTVKENADTVERFADSLDVARGILTRFPSQKKLSEELEKLKEQEASIVQRNQTLRKVIDAMGGKQVTISEFKEISSKMESKIAAMRRESEELSGALEEEKSTYLTFQRIKEKITPSIESYKKELARLDEDLKSAHDELKAQKKNIRDELKTFKENMKGKDASQVMKLAQEVKSRKQALEDIRSSLSSLKSSSENLNKRLNLLSREARLLELRGGTAPAKGEPAEKTKDTSEVREKLELTKDEEMEFRKKREELKKLIRKLWEET